MSANTDFFQAQYVALRGEIMYLMGANEKRVFGAAGFASTVWGILISLLAAHVAVPGAAFHAPGILLILALNVHITYSKRVANISSFLTHTISSFAPETPNWELEIGKFSQRPEFRMGTSISIVAIYWILAIIGTIGATCVPAMRIIRQGTLDFATSLDLLATVTLTILLLLALGIISSDYREFSKLRIEFDSYWNGRFPLPANGEDKPEEHPLDRGDPSEQKNAGEEQVDGR